MDILVAEDDSLVTLEEALAFIDHCGDVDASLIDGLTDTSVGCDSPLDLLDDWTKPTVIRPSEKRVAPAQPLEALKQQEEQPKKKRRARSGASSSTRLQQRKKAELIALREEAQELEAHVKQLKRSNYLPADVVLEMDADVTVAGDGSGGSLIVKGANQQQQGKWYYIAREQYRERYRAEKMNRKLKAILESQTKVNSSLDVVLQKRSALYGMDFVFANQPMPGPYPPTMNSPTARTVLSDMDNSRPIIAELEKLVENLYLDSRTVFKSTLQPPAISCDMQIKQDSRRGKTIEFVTTTPMACSMQEASDIIWEELTIHREYPDKFYHFNRGSKLNSQEKSFVMTLRNASGVIDVHGRQFMRKFEEKDRIVLVRADRMFLSTQGIQFRCQSWTVITPSESDPQASVVRTFLQLYMERVDGMSPRPEDIVHAQTLVMGSLSSKFRKFFQEHQNTLIEKGGLIVRPLSPPVVP
ncbi:hypothetical protein BBJ28_00002937 [Nothophytophthora sp. Chile5]|nr:hypothetical protein BBJ28_00002937 [Nothophytophthora sp. Chile5]